MGTQSSGGNAGTDKSGKALGERGQFQAEVFGEWCVAFVKRAERYRKMIEEFYYMFQDNHVLWEAVNTSYLKKLYDVFIPGETAAEKSVGFGDVKIDYGINPTMVKENVLLSIYKRKEEKWVA